MSRDSDPNSVQYHYVSRRLLRQYVAQAAAGKFKLPKKIGVAGLGDIELQPTDLGDFELVQRFERLLTETGTIDEPYRFVRDSVSLTCFVLELKNGYQRVAFVRSQSVTAPNLIVLVGSVENILGVRPREPDPTAGFFPSFGGGLESLVKAFTTKGRRGPLSDLPDNDDERGRALVEAAATFGYEFDEQRDQAVRVFSGRFEVCAELWYDEREVWAGSLWRGGKIQYDRVLVGTPLWIRSVATAVQDD